MKTNHIQPGSGIHDRYRSKTQQQKTDQTGFDQLLKEKTSVKNTIHFSKHAQQRIEQRSVKLEANDVQKISDAMDMADKKGIKNSLIIMDNIVLIANIQSRTVVTAIDKESMKEKVFTNVDGAVNI